MAELREEAPRLCTRCRPATHLLKDCPLRREENNKDKPKWEKSKSYSYFKEIERLQAEAAAAVTNEYTKPRSDQWLDEYR